MCQKRIGPQTGPQKSRRLEKKKQKRKEKARERGVHYNLDLGVDPVGPTRNCMELHHNHQKRNRFDGIEAVTTLSNPLFGWVGLGRVQPTNRSHLLFPRFGGSFVSFVLFPPFFLTTNKHKTQHGFIQR